MPNATVTSTASGSTLFKCEDWNFTTQTCFGSWQKIKDLTPGQEYNFILTAEDPGYAESGLASINTNKSIYHPNEEAKIIMVVLDTSGKLVSNANVVLNVTNPNNVVTTFTTDKDTINETQRGIYESIYSDTSLEGNYTMFVDAKAPDVNNSMVSFFTVKQFYEFDILRTTPVTTDPFTAPFNSSIKIVSFIDVNTFNYTEILPINFSINNSGGALYSIIDNKIYLTWNNLINNSIVSYVAKPPLVTPELWELGPSFVDYSSGTFTEARPWFLAVDPVNATGAPKNTLSFFMTDYFGGNKQVDNSDFEERPIQMNTYGHLSQKCSVWSCDTFTASGTNKQGRYCSGGWDCIRFNGTICVDWQCTGRTNTPNSNLNYCSSGWTCDTFTGDVCDAWNCSTFAPVPSTKREFYCSGNWVCDSFTGDNCNSWSCTERTIGSADDYDTYCSGGFDCTSLTNGYCDTWNCKTWTQASTNKRDAYCNGGWDCTSFNGSVCTGWDCLDWELSGTDDRDLYCESWNCTVWDQSREVCQRWNCSVPWTTGATNQQDFSCTSSWVCTEFQTFNDPPNVTLLHPPVNYFNDTPVPVNVTFNCSTADDFGLKNLSLYITNSQNTSFSFNDSCNVTGTSGACGWNKTLNLGNYIWNCLSYDEEGLSGWGANRSVDISLALSVILNKPVNNSFITSGSATLNCTATDDSDIVNISLYHNMSGTFKLNQTTNFTGSPNTTATSTYTFSFVNDTNFIWNCQAYDDLGYSLFANDNYSVRIRFPSTTFTDITSPSGLFNRTTGRGLCLEDYNKNGFVDVAFLGDNQDGINLFNNSENGAFVNNTLGLFSGSNLAGRGCSFGDYDNDGYSDLITASNLILYKNNKNNTFNCTDSEDDTACSGNALPVTSFSGKGVQFFDYNNDSYLDIWAPDTNGARIFENNANGTFSLVTLGSETIDEYSAVADYDGDGYLDVFALDGTTHIIYRNLGNGSFESITPTSIGLPGSSRSGGDAEDFHWAFGDYDNDGDLDVFITSTSIAERNFFENDGDGTFTDKTIDADLPTDDAGTDPVWGDYNNDGYLDLFIGGVGLFENDGDGTFTDKTSEFNLVHIPEAVEFFDFDNDGDLDIIGQNKTGVSIIYKNNLDDVSYLKIIVNGLGNKSYYNFSNKDAIGAKVDVYNSTNDLVCHREISGGEGYGQGPKIIHCGLESLNTYTVNVTFPSGRNITKSVVPFNEELTIKGNTLSNTIEINETDFGPAVTLISPSAAAVDTDGDVEFNCSATDDIDLVNLSLVTNESGSLIVNQTLNLTTGSDISNKTNFTMNNLPTGTVLLWNCLAYDAAGNFNYADQNRTLTVGAGSININISTDSELYGTNDTVTVTINTTDSDGILINATAETDLIYGETSYRWINDTLKYRCPIILNETLGINRTNHVFTINGSSLNASCLGNILNATEFSIRVFDNNTKEMPSHIDDWNTTKLVINDSDDRFDANDDLLFIYNLTANTAKTFLIYYDDVFNVSKNYNNSKLLIRSAREFALAGDQDNGWYLLNASRNGSFLPTEQVSETISGGGFNHWGIGIADFDNDGDYDFVASVQDANPNEVFFFENVNGVLQDGVSVGNVNNDVEVGDYTVADFDNDGNMDFIPGMKNDDLYLFSGNGDGTFTRTAITTDGPSTEIYGKDAADFNRDGCMDFAFAVKEATDFFVMLGNCDGTFDSGTDVIDPAADKAWGVAAGDFDSDGKDDLIIIAKNVNAYFYSGNGDGTFSTGTDLGFNPAGNEIPLDGFDFNHDGNLDIIYTEVNNEIAFIRFGNGDGTFGSESQISTIALGSRTRAFQGPEDFKTYSLSNTISSEEKFIFKNINETGIDGKFIFNFSTLEKIQGRYSLVTLGAQTGYLDDESATHFNISPIGTNPVITFVSPTNGTTLNHPNIYINVTTNKDATCKYSTNQLFDYDTQGTTFDVTGAKTHSANLGSLAEGSYTYYVKCRDALGNTNDNTDQGKTIFTVDRTNPGLTLVNPINNTNQTSTDITFSWTATDNIDDILLCDFTLNGEVKASDVSSTNGVQRDYIVTGLSNGNFTWNVTCQDNGGNINESETYIFSLGIIDLVIGIQTINNTYKGNKDIDLLSSIKFISNDQEPGISNVTAIARDLTDRTCSDSWGSSCNGCAANEEFLECPHNCNKRIIDDVYISQTNAKFGDTLTATCTFNGDNNADKGEIWYYNGTNFTLLRSITLNTKNLINYSTTFTVNSDNITQWVRCTIIQNGNPTGVYCPTAGQRDIDDANFTVGVSILDDNDNDTFTNYTDFGGDNFTKLTDIDINIEIINYNNSGSNNVSNDNADLEVRVFDGTSYSFSYLCSANSLGSTPFNCSKSIKDSTVLAAWSNATNRQIQVRGVFLDTENSFTDMINWSTVIAELETPSKFENIGPTNKSGNLLLSVQRNVSGTYTDFLILYNQSRHVGPNETINLTEIWNDDFFDTDNYPLGSYRAYVAFIDSNNNVIQSGDGRYLNDSFRFMIDYLRINITSPLNDSTHDAEGIYVNASLSFISYPSGGFCEYELDGGIERFGVIDGNLTGTYFDFGGNYTNITKVSDNSFWFVGDENEEIVTPHSIDASFNLTFNVGNMNPSMISNFSLELSYCHSGNTFPGVQCDGTAPTGTVETEQEVYIFNYSNEKWVLIGNLINDVDGTNGILVNDTFSPDGAMSDYVNSSSKQVKVGIRTRMTTSDYGQSAFLVLDYASLNTSYRVQLTNKSITEFYNFSNSIEIGNHYLQVFCNDTSGELSSSVIHNFTIEDLKAPIINLISPLNDSEEPDENVTFSFNVTDVTSSIANCTLVFDFQDNITIYNVTENTNISSINLTNLADDQHKWQIKCTDNSSNANVGFSDEFEFLVGIDNQPPVVKLTSPANNTNTQNNDVVFKYTAFDQPISDNIDNCSLVINSKINQTNNSIITEAGVENNFTIIDMPVAQYNWSVNCTDSSNNKNVGASGIFNLTISQDTDFPAVFLILPDSETTDTDGTIVFTYNVSDVSGDIAKCEIVVNGTVNQTETSITENTPQTFTISGFNDGFYNWSVNCTDDSFQANANSSATRNFTVLKLLGMKLEVNTDKSIYEKGTQFNESAVITTTTRDSLDNLIDINVTIDIIRANTTLAWWNSSWKLRKPIFLNDSEGKDFANVSVLVNITELGNNIQNCTEIRIIRNISLSHIEIENSIEAGDNATYCTVAFYANISQNALNESNYYAYYNFSGAPVTNINIPLINLSNNSRVGTAQELFNKSFDSTGTDGTIIYILNSTNKTNGVYSVISISNSSEYNKVFNFTHFEIRQDLTGPSIKLTSPAASFVSSTGNLTFIYNVTDSGSGISNCQLIIGGIVTQTNTTVQEGIAQNFTQYEIPNGDNTWQINCTDDSLAQNKKGSEIRDFNVQLDTEGPTVNLIGPKEGINDTDGNISFQYNVTDNFNGIRNCSIFINNTLNLTSYNVTKTIIHHYNISGFNNGTYDWNVVCFDNSSSENVGNSSLRNFSVIIDEENPIISLIFPGNDSQLVTGNITFIYNVTDVISNISNCSITLDGVLNQTNYTVTENTNQSFNITGINDGNHNWSITCTDGSDNFNNITSELRVFLISEDTEPPVINLVTPPDGIEIPDGSSIKFVYNVTDVVSDVKNCSIIINNTINDTIEDPSETENENFFVNDFNDGFYIWSINCTDAALVPNTGNSTTRNFTVGSDQTPPDVTLEAPANNSLDTDGVINFQYNVNDFGSGILNCSVFINDTINTTNSTPITEGSSHTITIENITDGVYSWLVSCIDDSPQENIGNSSFRIVNVTVDEEAPVVNLVAPSNESSDSDGNLLFIYNVSDTLNGVSNCSLYLDDVLIRFNDSITENTNQTFNVTSLGDGTYTWYVNCTDNSDNANIGKSPFQLITIQNDPDPPNVTIINPPDHTLETDGNRTFFYNVTDVLSGVASCSLIFNGNVQQSDTTITEGVLQNFTETDLTDQQINWTIKCTDSSDNNNVGQGNETRNLTVTLDNAVPVVNLVSPANNTQNVINNVTFIFNVSDTVSIANCSIFINGTLNQTNTTIVKDTRQNFTINNFDNVTILWSVACTDVSEGTFTGESENRTLIIKPDVVAPTIILLNPPNNIQDPDGNVLFEYNVTDFASPILNCSLIVNETINQTNTSITKGIIQNFSLTSMAEADYTWQVNCTDNSTAKNVGASEIRNLTIGVDQTPPTVTLIAPENNSIFNSQNVLYEYSVTDFSSDIKNCSLIINNEINQTDITISEDVSQFLNTTGQPDGNYNWSVNCTDTFNNTGASVVFNLTIFEPKQIIVNVSTNQSSYEQGNLALITTNTTNSSGEAFDANITVDIIRGNGTVPWWDTSWKYRVAVDINSTNVTRKNKLIEYEINFTDILVNDLGLSGLTFDNNSIRVLEFDNNESIEFPSQFKGSSNFNSENDSYGIVYWILNSTTNVDTIRNFYVYFDVEENGIKSAPSYTTPSFSFTGSSKNVNFDGTSTTADHVVISKDDESFTLQFSDGDDIDNQLNLDLQGSGSIYNININNNKLTNDNSSIIPIAVRANDFLTTSSTSTVRSGFVISTIEIDGSINSISGSTAQVNYTIWFVGDEIYVRAKLFADFASAETAPTSLFNNLWFAYFFDEGSSSWNSFINNLKSESYNDTHDYFTVSADLTELDAFRQTDWFAELKGGLGSINLFVENFTLNGAENTIGIISFDDEKLPIGSQSDGVGFNLNSGEDIAANDEYSMTVWMVFTSNSSNKKTWDFKKDIQNPLTITKKQGEEFINRTINETDSDGLFSFNFSTVNRNTGFYSAVSRAFKTLYKTGIDFVIFEITQDVTKPIVTSISPEGFVNTENTTFIFNVSDANNVSNCTVVLNNKLNVTNPSITNNAQNTITAYYLEEGPYNWSINCSDSAGNIGNSSIKNITVDLTEPGIDLIEPGNGDSVDYFDLNFF
jgi:hypothetical protein